MTVLVQSAPARPVRRVLGMAAVTSLVAVLAAPAALAQQPAAPAPAPKAAPKAAPKGAPKQQPAQTAPQQPAQQQQGQAAPGAGDQQMPVVYSPWTKFCGKDQNQAGAKEVCLTVKEARLETGQFLAGAALIEQEGEQKKIFRITLPLGMQLPQGTRVIVDQDQPVTGRYIVCLPNGCMADFEVQPDFVGKLKKGQQLTLQGINLPGQAASYPIPLADFAKANEGPPTDPKEFEAKQQKLQEELQKKSDELRKKMERQNAPGTGAAAPAR